MEDVTRKRVLRMLERLPEEQLYQVVDYIEFLEVKYAREAARKPDPFQRFAERVEDQMRLRSVAPKAMKGTMKVMSTAGRVLDGVRDLGKDLTGSAPRGRPEVPEEGASGDARGEPSGAKPGETGGEAAGEGDARGSGQGDGNG